MLQLPQRAFHPQRVLSLFLWQLWRSCKWDWFRSHVSQLVFAPHHPTEPRGNTSSGHFVGARTRESRAQHNLMSQRTAHIRLSISGREAVGELSLRRFSPSVACHCLKQCAACRHRSSHVLRPETCCTSSQVMACPTPKDVSAPGLADTTPSLSKVPGLTNVLSSRA